jgi:hypothetical protein
MHPGSCALAVKPGMSLLKLDTERDGCSVELVILFTDLMSLKSGHVIIIAARNAWVPYD